MLLEEYCASSQLAQSSRFTLYLQVLLISMADDLFSNRHKMSELERTLREVAGFWCLARDMPNADDDGDTTEVPASIVQGIYFLADIVVEERRDANGKLVYRVPRGFRVPDWQELARHLGKNNWAEVAAAFGETGDDDDIPVPVRSQWTNKVRTVNVSSVDGAPAVRLALGLHGMGVTIPHAVAGTNWDYADGEAAEEEYEALPATANIDDVVDDIVHQMARDVLHLAPFRRMASKQGKRKQYLTLGEGEMQAVTLRTFLQSKLPFDAAWTSTASPAEWDHNFDLLFPAKGELTVETRRNFGNALYYTKWRRLMSRLTSAHAGTVRGALKTMFQRSVLWLPRATETKIWSTHSPDTGRWTRLALSGGRRGPAPVVFLHTNRVSLAAGAPITRNLFSDM